MRASESKMRSERVIESEFVRVQVTKREIKRSKRM